MEPLLLALGDADRFKRKRALLDLKGKLLAGGAVRRFDVEDSLFRPDQYLLI